MYNFPIGVMLNSLKMDNRLGIEAAAAMGASGLQMYATVGPNAPENLTAENRRELLDMVKSHGMCFSAICGDLGQGFCSREKNPALIEKSKRILDLAKELETDIVTTHIGVVPESPEHERYKIMQEACFELSSYADSLGAHFAVETGPETAATLRAFLDSLGSRGVAVNFDPANLVMVTGDDPVSAVATLGDYIVHTHAKDGRKLWDKSPEIIYGLRREETPTGRPYIELPLGTGDVDFKGYLAALEAVGYRGFLTIEREVGENPYEDIKTAFRFLRKIIES